MILAVTLNGSVVIRKMADFFEFFVSADLQSRLWWLRIIFIVLGIYFIFGLFYFGRLGYFRERSRKYRYWREYKEEFSASQKHGQEWARREKYLSSDLSADHKRAVVEAGQLLESVLISAGAGQGDFSDKTRRVIIKEDFDFEKLFQVHDLWKSIINNPQKNISQEEAKKALIVYKEALVVLKYF